MNTTRFCNGFSEKIIFWGKRVILGLKMVRPHNFVSTLRIFFEILHNEWDQELHGNYINGFPEKNSHLGQMHHFRPKNGACS